MELHKADSRESDTPAPFRAAPSTETPETAALPSDPEAAMPSLETTVAFFLVAIVPGLTPGPGNIFACPVCVPSGRHADRAGARQAFGAYSTRRALRSASLMEAASCRTCSRVSFDGVVRVGGANS